MSQWTDSEGAGDAENSAGQRHKGGRTCQDGEDAPADQESAGQEDGVWFEELGIPGEHGWVLQTRLSNFIFSLTNILAADRSQWHRFMLLASVEDLEEKVRSSRRYRRNSLHHTQMLESQMKTVKGELVGTLDHLQELRNVLRRSQQKAEERKAAMEKLAAGLRWRTLTAINLKSYILSERLCRIHI